MLMMLMTNPLPPVVKSGKNIDIDFKPKLDCPKNQFIPAYEITQNSSKFELAEVICCMMKAPWLAWAVNCSNPFKPAFDYQQTGQTS